MNNLRFGDGIEIRIDNDDSKDRILVVCAIEFKRCTGKVLPIRFNLLRTLWVFARGVTPVETLCPRRKQLQCRKVPVIDGEVFHGSRREDRCDVSLFGLKLRNLACDLDRLRDRAHL